MRNGAQFAVAVLTVSLVVSGCSDGRNPAGPEASSLRWGWDKPLGTGTPAAPSMSCSSPFGFFGTATCTASNIPPTGSPSWRFVTDGGVPSTGASFGVSWSGPVVASGTASISFVDQNGNPQTLSAAITVPRRTVSWAPTVGGSTGAPGQVDSCFSSAWDGLTTSKNCTSPNDAGEFFIPKVADLDIGNGFSVAVVTGTGPNAGLWFVDQMTADMDLRTQVSVRLRNPGTAYSLASAPVALRNACASAFPQQPTADRSQYQANNVCTSNTINFNNLVSCIWSHEARHLNAGIDEARSSINDVYLLWEPLVRATAADVKAAAKQLFNGAETRVGDILIAAHNSLQPHAYMGWWRTPSQDWTQFAYPQTCLGVP
jgi:hypothetical protein